MEKYNKIVGKISTSKFGDIVLYETNDYSIFRFYSQNRVISNGHVRRLAKSMKKDFLFTIIFVDMLYFVIDGQHRLKACQKLNMPIIYAVLVGYDSKQVSVYNTNTERWSPGEFEHLYCAEGNPDYIEYAEFRQKTGLPHRCCQQLLLNSTNSDLKQIFEEGDFKITARDYANKISGISLQMKFNQNRSVSFITALARSFNKEPKIEPVRLIRGVNNNHFELQGHSRASKDYELILNKLYNKNYPKSKHLYWVSPEDYLNS